MAAAWDLKSQGGDTVRVRLPSPLPLKMKGDISMKFKVKHYSNERLHRELEEAHSRLRGYLDARDHMPLSSILGSLAIASGIKYENALIAALFEELESRGE